MFDHLVRNRAAFDAGAQTERSRIARDIHDHVGASLLDALHSEEAGRKDRLIRETLADLRGIVNGVDQPEQPLDRALLQIRREIAERPAAKGLCPEWNASAASARTRVGEGKSVSVRVALGGRRSIKKN